MGADQEEATSGYAQETELHGLPQLLAAEGKVEKLCWIITLTLALVFVIKGTVTTAVRFSEQPTVTHMSVTAVDKFPAILLCHGYWVNEGILRSHGFKEDHLDSIGRIFAVPQAHMLRERNKTRDQAFVKAIKNHDLDAFLEGIAYKPDQVVPTHQPYLIDANATLTFRLTAVMPCYMLNINTTMNPFVAGLAYYEIRIRNTNPAFGRTGKFVSDMLYLGKSAESMIPENGVPVVPGKVTSVQITMSRVTRLNRRAYDCSENEQKHRSFCFIEQMNEMCHKDGRKPYYAPFRGYKIHEISTYMAHENKNKKCDYILDSDYSWQDDASEKCLPPCDAWYYHVTVAPVSGDEKGEGAVMVGLRYPFDVMHLKEHFEMTIDSFFSAIGGNWGLWSGASVVSVIHMLMFCVFKKRKATARVDTEKI